MESRIDGKFARATLLCGEDVMENVSKAKIILFGVILTDMCANVAPEVLEELAEEAPVGRNGTPEDVARVVESLADAEFVTGQVLGVSGGFVM